MSAKPSLPRDLAQRTRFIRVGQAGIPALLAHPDWQTPGPAVIWLHGRTVNKELDPGRYLRWLRAGIGVCAIDLPAHGERFDAANQHPRHSLATLMQAASEIDYVVEALAEPVYQGVFDLDRLGIGGMSLGGMTALRRLCNPHEFKAAAIEGSTGWLRGLYFAQAEGVRFPAGSDPTWLHSHATDDVARADTTQHLAEFRPVPLLVLHSEADQVVPWDNTRRFVDRLRQHYRSHHAAETLIKVHTWPQTGAPQEHVGFGRVSNDAKNLQTAFFAENLNAKARTDF